MLFVFNYLIKLVDLLNLIKFFMLVLIYNIFSGGFVNLFF